MKKLLIAALLGASSVVAMAPANAVATLTLTSTVDGVKFYDSTGGFQDFFDGTGILVIPEFAPGVGKFVLTFSFATPVGVLNSSGTTVALAKSSDIDFKNVTTGSGPTLVTYKAITLNGVNGLASNEAGSVGTSTWKWPDNDSVDTIVNPQILRVSGESFGANASLSGSVTFLAVPEPATWALMILGFGMVGGAMRSRRRGVVAA